MSHTAGGRHTPRLHAAGGAQQEANPEAASHLLAEAHTDALTGGHMAVLEPANAAHLEEAVAHQEAMRQRQKSRSRSRLQVGGHAAPARKHWRACARGAMGSNAGAWGL